MRVFFGGSAYGKSFGGGGWISLLGRALSVASDRRIVGMEVDGLRAVSAFFGGAGAGGEGAGGGGVGSFLTIGFG